METISNDLAEKDLQRNIIALAQQFGWMAYFTWSSRHSPMGFPDLVLSRNGQLIFAELKTQKGRLGPAQGDWRNEIEVAQEATDGAVRYFLWRPSDWYHGLVDEALR